MVHLEAQVIGDYVGRRFATFSNDASVSSYFLTSLRIAAWVPEGVLPLRKVELALNVTNPPTRKASQRLVATWTFRPENRFLAADFRNGGSETARNPDGSVSEIRRYLAEGFDAFFTDDPKLGQKAVK